jgi:anthranilate phosphoribosyltransferase
MIKEAIAKAVVKVNLSPEEAEGVMEEIMSGTATPAQIGSFITALRMKGESIDEITAFAMVMRRHSARVNARQDNLLDTCGTGGDGKHTFNISTIAALVAAGAGVVIAKHGNRSISSRCGSADLLKELGVNIEAPLPVVERCINEAGIGFLFAPMLHPAMKFAAVPRREIGIRTIFNILGPLTNPAGASCQLLGVYDASLTKVFAEVLKNLGSNHAMIVHGSDGLDEVTITGDTIVSELFGSRITDYRIKPEDFGMKRASAKYLDGGDPAVNANIAMEILNGKEGPGRDVLLLNAGCAIYVAHKAKDIKEGIELARKSIDSKEALRRLELLKEYTNAVYSEQ